MPFIKWLGYCQGWRVLYNGCNCVFVCSLIFFSFFFLDPMIMSTRHVSHLRARFYLPLLVSRLLNCPLNGVTDINAALKGLKPSVIIIISHIHQTWVNCCTNSHLGGEWRKIASMRTHPLVTIWIAPSCRITFHSVQFISPRIFLCARSGARLCDFDGSLAFNCFARFVLCHFFFRYISSQRKFMNQNCLIERKTI